MKLVWVWYITAVLCILLGMSLAVTIYAAIAAGLLRMLQETLWVAWDERQFRKHSDADE